MKDCNWKNFINKFLHFPASTDIKALQPKNWEAFLSNILFFLIFLALWDKVTFPKDKILLIDDDEEEEETLDAGRVGPAPREKINSESDGNKEAEEELEEEGEEEEKPKAKAGKKLPAKPEKEKQKDSR